MHLIALIDILKDTLISRKDQLKTFFVKKKKKRGHLRSFGFYKHHLPPILTCKRGQEIRPVFLKKQLNTFRNKCICHLDQRQIRLIPLSYHISYVTIQHKAGPTGDS